MRFDEDVVGVDIDQTKIVNLNLEYGELFWIYSSNPH